jgi:hypothetical protein
MLAMMSETMFRADGRDARAGTGAVRWLGGLLLVISTVGLLDAVFTTEYDFAVLFGVAALIGVVQVAVCTWSGPAVALRRDVDRWLRQRSLLTGEPVDRLADRAVSTYRAALAEGPDAAGEP